MKRPRQIGGENSCFSVAGWSLTSNCFMSQERQEQTHQYAFHNTNMHFSLVEHQRKNRKCAEYHATVRDDKMLLQTGPKSPGQNNACLNSSMNLILKCLPHQGQSRVAGYTLRIKRRHSPNKISTHLQSTAHPPAPSPHLLPLHRCAPNPLAPPPLRCSNGIDHPAAAASNNDGFASAW